MKKMNLLWVIIIALSAAFIGCSKEDDPTPVVPPTDTTSHGTVKDSIIVEVTLDLPECVVLSQSIIKIMDSVYPEGLMCQVANDNRRVFRFASADQKLIGSSCKCTSLMEGRCNDYPACFDYENPEDSGKTITVQKGVNKVILKYTVK